MLWQLISDKSLVQFLIFPIVLLFVARLSIFGLRVPQSILTAAILIFLFLAVGAFVYLPELNGRYAIAVLQDDTYETKTYQLRTAANRQLEQRLHKHRDITAVSFARYPRKVNTAQEAGVAIKANKLSMLVWGNSRWLNISFPLKDPINLRSLLPDPEVLPLHIIDSVPVVGLSFAPLGATAQFAAEVCFADQYAPATLQAGRIQALWTSPAHKALAYFRYGNKLLISGVQAREPEKVDESYRSYKNALILLRSGDNVELETAILNNMAIANFISGPIFRQTKYYRSVVNFLKLAQATEIEKNLFKVDRRNLAVAKRNFELVRKYDQAKRNKRAT